MRQASVVLHGAKSLWFTCKQALSLQGWRKARMCVTGAVFQYWFMADWVWLQACEGFGIAGRWRPV